MITSICEEMCGDHHVEAGQDSLAGQAERNTVNDSVDP